MSDFLKMRAIEGAKDHSTASVYNEFRMYRGYHYKKFLFSNGTRNLFCYHDYPDVYTLFVKEMVNAGYTEAYAKENIKTVDVPRLPKSGDLEDESQGFIDMTVMGGVNGYAISSYTKAPNAALAFVNFATSYKMIQKRCELLGISPDKK